MSTPPARAGRPVPGDELSRAGLADRALKRLAGAYQAARVSQGGSSAGEPAQQFLELHTRYTERYGPLTLLVTRSSFILETPRTELTDEFIVPLAQSLHARLIRRFSVLPGVSPGEIQHLIATLTAPSDTVLRAGGADRVLRERGVTRIVLEPTGAASPAGGTQERAAAILRLFVAASKNTRLYPSGHPSVAAAVEMIAAALAPVLAGLASVDYSVRDGMVFCNQELLGGDPRLVEEFAAACTARRIGSLTFRRGVTRDELAHAVTLFGSEPERLIVEGGFAEALAALGVTHLSAGPPEASEETR